MVTCAIKTTRHRLKRPCAQQLPRSACLTTPPVARAGDPHSALKRARGVRRVRHPAHLLISARSRPDGLHSPLSSRLTEALLPFRPSFFFPTLSFCPLASCSHSHPELSAPSLPAIPSAMRFSALLTAAFTSLFDFVAAQGPPSLVTTALVQCAYAEAQVSGGVAPYVLSGQRSALSYTDAPLAQGD